ncbi:protein c-Fos-like isoform X2 [Ornithodoros turicata]|uniref:protein c-Fos-like isoform X2 n=1 Tax=Ornithodoros turicata TaxID=34597 RepID=UPI003139FD97
MPLPAPADGYWTTRAALQRLTLTPSWQGLDHLKESSWEQTGCDMYGTQGQDLPTPDPSDDLIYGGFFGCSNTVWPVACQQSQQVQVEEQSPDSGYWENNSWQRLPSCEQQACGADVLSIAAATQAPMEIAPAPVESPMSSCTPGPMNPPPTPPSPTDTCYFTPVRSVLIKNCLKLTIKQRREAQGLGDIAPEYKPPSIDTEDEEKRNKRRERNKIAASKCRNRKKERTVRLAEESEHLQKGNADLRRELLALQQEVQQLTHVLRTHACVCPGAFTNNNR